MNLTGVPDMVTTFSRAMAMQQEAKAYRRCAEWMKTLEAEQCWDFESPFEAWAVEAERRANVPPSPPDWRDKALREKR